MQYGQLPVCKMTLNPFSESGVVFVWGCNQHGQCGQPCDKLFFTQPQPIRGDLENVKVVDIQSGWTHIVATSGN